MVFYQIILEDVEHSMGGVTTSNARLCHCDFIAGAPSVSVSHIVLIPNPEAHLAQWQIFVNSR